MNIIKTLQIASAFSLVVVAAIAVIFETGLLQPGLVHLDPTGQYIIDFVGILTMLVGVPIGMKAKDKPFLRFALLNMAINVNLIIYYMTYSNATLACFGIALVAFVLMWPRNNTPEI